MNSKGAYIYMLAYWYEQDFYGCILFGLIQFFKFYVLEGEDIALLIFKYFRGKK